MKLEPTFWVVKIRSGGITFTKGMRITPIERNMTIDDAYVRAEVERQQKVVMYRSGTTAMPQGRIISIERRDPTKPRPAHIGHWEKGGIILEPSRKLI